MGKFYEGVGEDLTLYARQSAWLHATIERPKDDRSNEPQTSRLQRLRKLHGDDYEPPMPQLEAGSHLLAYLFEIGPVMPGGMGPVAISHTEIRAWTELTGIELSAWEARTLRRLSRAYLGQLHDAEKHACPAPWDGEIDKPRDNAAKAKVAQDMRDTLRRLAKN